MFFLTEDLLSSAKLRSMAPISQNTFQDPDLIIIANEELQTKIVPDIMTIREDFFLTSETTSVVALVDHYTIPSRAIGNSLKLVYYVDSQGNKYKLVKVDPERIADFVGTTGVPNRFYIEGDEVVVIPTPQSDASGSIQFFFYARPNKIVATSSCAKITAVSSAGGTTTFTVDTDLSATLSVGSYVDILNAKSPFLLWAYNKAITAITATTIAVATTDVSNTAGTVEPQVGDYISATGEANIAQIPQEFHPVHAQMIAVRLIEALGDAAKAQILNATLQQLRADTLKLIKNRVESSPERINTRGGLLSYFK